MTRGEAVIWLGYISEDIGKAEHRALWHYEQTLDEIKDMLEGEPERKTGKWKETDDGWDGIYYVCSECGCPWTLIDGTPYDNGMNYCPNCGAKMEGEA